MSHLFISYSHRDRKHLDNFLAFLKENQFDDIWFDDHIEAGTRWIEEIDTALEEAFALVVIATPQSMNSLYVTYEWSSLLGIGMPVIPLLFEGTYDDIHKRLRYQIHVADCREIIPNSLIDTIKSHQITTPEIDFINTWILRRISRWEASVFITEWFSKQEENNNSIDLRLLVIELVRETQYAYTDLAEFIVMRKYAFTTKQVIKLRELVKKLREFHRIFLNKDNTYKQPFSYTIAGGAECAERIKSLIDFFRVDDSIKDRLEIFKNMLNALSDKPEFESYNGDTFSEMLQEFFSPNTQYIGLIKRIIEKTSQRKSKNNS